MNLLVVLVCSININLGNWINKLPLACKNDQISWAEGRKMLCILLIKRAYLADL